MAGNLLGVGVSAINNAQLSLLTTQHNISNASTPGFHRQEAIQSSNTAQATGAGYVGSGAHIQTVQRIYDQFLDSQVSSASTQTKFYDAYQAQIKQIDDLLANPSTGLSPAIQGFFTGVSAVANDPSSVAARQSLLSSGESLVANFQSLYKRIDDIRNGVNTQLSSLVTNINSVSSQIADLNDKVARAQSATNQPPNDLLDQRDQAIATLNEMVNTTVVKQSDGSYNVFIGNGQSLVTGSTAFTLAVQNDANDPAQKNVAYAVGSGYVTIPSANLENGGTLGGLLAFRRLSLDDAQNALGRVALGLAETFNNQHQLGQDLNGALGTKFFNIATTSPAVYPNSGNASSGAATIATTLSATGAGALTTSNYSLRYSSASSNYTLTQLSDGTVTTIASSALPSTTSYGFTIALSSGAPANGDQWLITPTRFGARDISVALTDPNQIAAAAPIRSASSTANTGTGSISLASVNTASQPPLNSAIQHTVSITFTSATTFNVVDTTASSTLATGSTYTSGSAISYNGWTVALTGAPASGDVFTVATNTGGVGDNRNAVALAALQSMNLLANNSSGVPTTSYQGAYAQMVSSVGSKTQQVQANATAQQTLLDNATQTQQQLSGVNLDEEAANLLRFQQAYQAAAKMIQIGSTLFATILAIQ